jgi:uncharacterized membrane protein
MDIDLVKQIVDYIRELAEPMVTSGYELVLRQVQFKMIFDIIICVALIAVFYFGIVCIHKGAAMKEDSCYSMYESWYVLAGIMLTTSPIVFFLNLYSILNTLINPDWVAIQTLMALIANN